MPWRPPRSSGITATTTFTSATEHAATEGHKERQHFERGQPATPMRGHAAISHEQLGTAVHYAGVQGGQDRE
jgi:hypothetical protein